MSGGRGNGSEATLKSSERMVRRSTNRRTRSSRGSGAPRTVPVVLSRRAPCGKREDAEIALPYCRSAELVEKIFDQITSRFPPRDLIMISTKDSTDRAATCFTKELNALLQMEKQKSDDSYEQGTSESDQEYSYPYELYDGEYDLPSGHRFSHSESTMSTGEDDGIEYKIRWVENRVEVPKIEIVEKIVEVPQIEVVERYETVTEIQEVEVPVYREVVKAVIQEVERRVEVPGEIIESVKEVQVEIIKHQDVFHDHDVPVAVAQTMQPILKVESSNVMKSPALIYQPVLKEVNVYVPIPVEVPVDGPFRLDTEYEKLVESEITAPQYNSITLALNRNLLSDQPELFNRMRQLEDAVKRVNPELDTLGSDLLTVRHNDNDNIFSTKLPMLKRETGYPGKVPFSADASVAAPKSSVIREMVNPKVLEMLNTTIA